MAATDTYTPRLKQTYEQEIRPRLKDELGLDSVFASPTPMLSVIFSMRGACMIESSPSSSFRRGRISRSYCSFRRGV